MGPIFNKKVAEKWNVWVRKQCICALFIVDLVILCGCKKKKKKSENADAGFIRIQTGTICI